MQNKKRQGIESMLDLKGRTVLVVDDEVVNLDYLVAILSNGVDIAVAMDGPTALAMAYENPPDLILLDVLMPGMDGFEVCRRLLADERTRDIPVVFVTVVTDIQEIVRGLELGAIDYITKPFEPTIVRARVRNYLSRKLALDRVREQNAALHEAAAYRADMERITRHDLKGPLTAILCYAELALDDPLLPPSLTESMSSIKLAGHKVLELIDMSVNLLQMERGLYEAKREPVDVLGVTRELAGDYAAKHARRQLTIAVTLDGRSASPEDTLVLPGERLLFYSALGNLVNNAAEASPENGTVHIALESRPAPTIRIRNLGEVPQAIRDRFFEKDVTSGKTHGTGLGTYSARLFTEALGGQIALDSSRSGETCVILRFPPAEGRVPA